MSTIVSLGDVVTQERTAGASDAQIVRLLNASRLKPPTGRAWTEATLVEAFGPRLQGMTRR